MIEIVRQAASAASAKVAIFDFDGTLSVIRSGWMEVMVPLCIDELKRCQSGENEQQLRSVVEEFVWRLTGKETIYQMMALEESIRERGGTPREPAYYKRLYLERLLKRISHRLESLRKGSAAAAQYQVPGAASMLEYLSARGLTLYLASGTDDANVKEEAALLGLSRFFGDRIYGAQEDLKSFSKALLVNQILAGSGYTGDDLVVFGDGFVEIEEVKRVGGTAVGLATAEPDCAGIDSWKRDRLVQAGADFIIPSFADLPQIEEFVFPGEKMLAC